MSEDESPPEARFALDWPEAPRNPGTAAGQAPAEVRLQWEARTDPAAAPPEVHGACRQEIERLEALVAELRREVSSLRRRAQLRAR